MDIVWLMFQFNLNNPRVPDVIFGRILYVRVIRVRCADGVIASGQIAGQEGTGAGIGFGNAGRGDLKGVPKLNDAASAYAQDFDIADDAWHGHNDSFAVGSPNSV
jgi:hypothetical protein